MMHLHKWGEWYSDGWPRLGLPAIMRYRDCTRCGKKQSRYRGEDSFSDMHALLELGASLDRP